MSPNAPVQQNGHLSFMPEDYGKEKVAPSKRTRNHTSSGTPNATPLNGSSSQGSPSDEPLQPGQLRCEFCHVVGETERFLPPSRRFCSLTCCKRYSAEKRYYPYGKDEQGIAKSIREGLLNPRSRHLRPGANKQVCVCECVLPKVVGATGILEQNLIRFHNEDNLSLFAFCPSALAAQWPGYLPTQLTLPSPSGTCEY